MLPAQSEDYSDRQTQLSSNWFAQKNTIRKYGSCSKEAHSQFSERHSVSVPCSTHVEITSRAELVRDRRSGRHADGEGVLPLRNQRDRRVESLRVRNSDRGRDHWHGQRSYAQGYNLQDSR